MGLMWFAVGLIAGLSVLAWLEVRRRFDVGPLGGAGLLLGEFLVLFCIAWSAASAAEGEPRAASMGAIMFGGAGLILLVLSWRFLVSKKGETPKGSS